MQGLIKGLNNGTNDIYPVTIAEGVYVGPSETLAQRLASGSTTGASYIIELMRWGINQGIPAKPYQNADYLAADNNAKGINDALAWAKGAGYTDVILPTGMYAVCYPRSIQMQSYLTLNLNGSTLKVIFDSDNRSPLDTRTGNPDPATWEGVTFQFDNVQHAKLINGTIIGCREDRSYSNVSVENKLESAYGLWITNSSSNNEILHCKIGAYTGDSINFVSSAVGEKLVFPPDGVMTFTAGNLDANGVVIASTTEVLGELVTLPVLSAPYSAIQICGAGTTRLTNLHSHGFDVAFYKSDDTFIGKFKGQKIYEPITIPKNAAKYRMVFYKETDPTRNLIFRIVYGDIPHHNRIAFCDIYGCQRGGIQGGGTHNIIEYNRIRDTGKGSTAFIDGSTVFFDPTKYCFNQEDNYGDGVILRHNHFYGGFDGILAGVYTITVEDNHFYNMDYIAINLYSVQHASVRGNYIYNCQQALGLMFSGAPSAYADIRGNYIFNCSALGLSPQDDGSKYRVNFSDNYLVDVGNMVFRGANEPHIFERNTIRYIDFKNGNPTFAVDKVVNCIFECVTGSQKRLDAQVYNYEGCTFDNIAINVQSRNDATKAEKVNFNRCTFKNGSEIQQIITNEKGKTVLIERSKLTDTRLFPSMTWPSMVDQQEFFIVRDSEIVVNNNTDLAHPYVNGQQAYISYENCDITIANATFARLISNDVAYNQMVTATFRKCNFKYTGWTAEVSSLQITNATGATTAGNITITLDGVPTNVALLTTDNTPTLVATKIRGTNFTGWTTGGTGDTITFTANTPGNKTNATYNAGTTGAIGTMTTITQGTGNLALVYYQIPSVMTRFISSLNTFTNIDLPTPDSTIFLDDTMGTSAPTTGTWKVRDQIINSVPKSSDGILGWICTVAGTPGTWIPITTSREKNVRNFGAVGDGVANDLPAFTAAIAAAKADSSNVFVPAGSYYVADFIGLESNMIIRGEGKTITSILSADAKGVFKGAGTSVQQKFISIRDLQVRPKNQALVGGTGIGIDSSWIGQSSYDNILIGGGFTTGIKMDGSSNICYYNVISNSRIQQCQTGISFSNAANGHNVVASRIIDCEIAIDLQINAAANTFTGVGIETTVTGALPTGGSTQYAFRFGQNAQYHTINGCRIELSGTGETLFVTDASATNNTVIGSSLYCATPASGGGSYKGFSGTATTTSNLVLNPKNPTIIPNITVLESTDATLSPINIRAKTKTAGGLAIRTYSYKADNATLQEVWNMTGSTDTPSFSFKNPTNVLFETSPEITSSGGGLLLHSPNGTRYKISVDNSGVISVNPF